MEELKEDITKIIENITDSSRDSGSSTKPPSTPEGMAVAYGSLVIMAMLPIFFGSMRSVHQPQGKSGRNQQKDQEVMTSKDAMMFPIIASGALFGLYMIFKIFSKDYINLLLTGYFFFLGVLALANLLSPVIGAFLPSSLVENIPFHIGFTKGEGSGKKHLINYKFTSYDIVCLILSLIIGVWYLFKKHWIANNLFGIAFAVNGVELLHLQNFIVGLILLSGLFVYDIFWVFGTNVMVTVAKSFDAPIKLVFPQDLITNGFNASNFAMLGLGDIVIPGIFIALLLRFDHSLKRNGKKTYFYATFVAYFLGLVATIFVMHMFKHAQPALLYLVPACLATPMLVALINGDVKTLLAYDDSGKQGKGKESAGKKEDKSNKENKKKEAKKAK